MLLGDQIHVSILISLIVCFIFISFTVL